MQKAKLFFLKLISTLCLLSAVINANSGSFYMFYQDKESDKVKKLRRF